MLLRQEDLIFSCLSFTLFLTLLIACGKRSLYPGQLDVSFERFSCWVCIQGLAELTVANSSWNEFFGTPTCFGFGSLIVPVFLTTLKPHFLCLFGTKPFVFHLDLQQRCLVWTMD